MKNKKMIVATIRSRGEVTIPKEIRDKSGLEAGTIIVFDHKKGKKMVTIHEMIIEEGGKSGG